MDITKFKTTKNEVSGIRYRIGDAAFIIASFNSPAYQEALRQELEPYQRDIRRDTLDPEVRHKLMVKAMSRTIVLGWDNLTDGGKAVPYSAAKAEQLLTDYPKFFGEVLAVASSAKGYEDGAADEALDALKKG